MKNLKALPCNICPRASVCKVSSIFSTPCSQAPPLRDVNTLVQLQCSHSGAGEPGNEATSCLVLFSHFETDNAKFGLQLTAGHYPSLPPCIYFGLPNATDITWWGSQALPTPKYCSLVPRPHPAHARRRGLVSQVQILGASSRNVERPIISQNSIYWNNADARTATSIVLLKVTLWNSLLTLTNL